MTRNIAFSLTMSITALLVANVAANAEEKDGLSKRDRFLAQAQQICPVTGKDLTSMGGPIKAEVDGQTVFLCCRGCIGRPLNAKHWKAAQTNLSLARVALVQQICPVMGKDLLSMGGPVNAKVAGQATFLCCKGCFGKDIKREHWAKIQSNLKRAQKICPVRNVELGDEAVPVVVEGRVVFVCCNSGYCIKQVKDDPKQYLAKVDKLLEENLARANRER